MPSNLLTKSRYLNGLQCLRYLWTVFNDPEKTLETDTATQYVFEICPSNGVHLFHHLRKALRWFD